MSVTDIADRYIVTDFDWAPSLPMQFATEAEAVAFAESEAAQHRRFTEAYPAVRSYCHGCGLRDVLCVHDGIAWRCYRCGDNLTCDECGAGMTDALVCSDPSRHTAEVR